MVVDDAWTLLQDKFHIALDSTASRARWGDQMEKCPRSIPPEPLHHLRHPTSDSTVWVGTELVLSGTELVPGLHWRDLGIYLQQVVCGFWYGSSSLNQSGSGDLRPRLVDRIWPSYERITWRIVDVLFKQVIVLLVVVSHSSSSLSLSWSCHYHGLAIALASRTCLSHPWRGRTSSTNAVNL